MLATHLETIEKYDFLSGRLRKAYEFLRRPDLATIEPGLHPIDGEKVFANVQEFITIAQSEKHFEAHRRYADVHYVVSGEELLGIAPVSELTPISEFDEETDFGLYGDPKRCSWVVLHPGELVITMPEDAHKPGCSLADPMLLRKVCVKVRLD